MTRTKIDRIGSTLYSMIGHFNVNVAMTDEVPRFVQEMDENEREEVRQEYKRRIKERFYGMNDFYDATSCLARDEKSARKFFEDVYKYAFEGGEEPEVGDYWDTKIMGEW